MRSPGGKVEWLCPKCRSEHIARGVAIGKAKAFMCGGCGQWGPWRERIKVTNQAMKRFGTSSLHINHMWHVRRETHAA